MGELPHPLADGERRCSMQVSNAESALPAVSVHKAG